MQFQHGLISVSLLSFIPSLAFTSLIFSPLLTHYLSVSLSCLSLLSLLSFPQIKFKLFPSELWRAQVFTLMSLYRRRSAITTLLHRSVYNLHQCFVLAHHGVTDAQRRQEYDHCRVASRRGYRVSSRRKKPPRRMAKSNKADKTQRKTEQNSKLINIFGVQQMCNLSDACGSTVGGQFRQCVSVPSSAHTESVLVLPLVQESV